MFNEKGNYQYPGDMVKSTYDSNNDGVVNAADTVPWSGVTNTPDTLSGYGIEEVPASVLSGVIGLEHIPPSAVERMKIVENDSMRFALTTADVQNGDTVKVTATNKMYLVVDDGNLDSESGYMVYEAGRAAAVDWAGVENKPETIENIDDILDTSEEESDAGNPITIETDSAQFAKNTHLTFEPIQDLHGYDHPWPAGGGKNLANINRFDNLQWDNDTIISNGVTFRRIKNSAGQYIGISANGTATGTAQVSVIIPTTNMIDGDILSGSIPNGSIYFENTNSHYTHYGLSYSGGEAPINFKGESPTTAMVILRFFEGANANGTFLPMIRHATESDATFEPYSNICPISGLDEVSVKRTGKNLFDEKYEGISSSLIYMPIFVGNNTVTLSTTMPTQSGGGRNLFLLTGNVTTGASSSLNGVSVNAPRFEQATNGFVTVAFRNENDVDPRNYQTQLELGSTATEYEPYTEQVINESLPKTIYGGTLDLETGEVVADMGIVNLGSLTWLNNQSRSNAYEAYSMNSLVKPNTTNLLSNVLVQKSSFVDVAEYTIRMGDDFLAVKVPKSVANDGVNMKQWLTDNNVVLCYELATPVTYQLTPQQLALLKGTNHISTNAKSVKVTFRNGKLALMEDIPQQLAIEEKKTDEKISTSIFPILGDFADIETSPATRNHAVGDYLIYDSKLYKVIAAITAGESLAEGTNIQRTTVMAELIALTQ